MEKKQSDLCLEILRRFHKAGILDDLILIGSWCVYFYREYFSNVSYIDQNHYAKSVIQDKERQKSLSLFSAEKEVSMDGVRSPLRWLIFLAMIR